MDTITTDHRPLSAQTVARAAPGLLRSNLRRHSLFAVLFGAGVALRVLTMLAYRPALVFHDSRYYLSMRDLGWQPGTSRPVGYVILLLRPVLNVGDLRTVVTVQHVLGLATAVVAYAVLLRCGARRWLAAVAVAPILLDAYIVQIEHFIMPEALFHALLVGALALLTWQRRPSLAVATAGGLLLATAVTVRHVGQILGVPAALFMLAAGDRPRRRVIGALVLSAAFIAPLFAYGLWFQRFHGELRLSSQSPALLYGRVAPFVDCSTLDVPPHEAALCPALPPQDRPGPGMYVHAPTSPLVGYQPPPGMQKGDVVNDFAVRAIRHQPFDYLRAVLSDFAWGFVWTKTNKPGNPAPVERWQFQPDFPVLFDGTPAFLRRYGDEGPSVNPRLARLLRSYQLTVGYTRGTVVLAALVAGALGAIGMGPARRSGLQATCLLWTLVPVSLLLVPAAMFEFTWRYQLPGIVLLPIAGALGITAARRTPRGQVGAVDVSRSAQHSSRSTPRSCAETTQPGPG